MAIMQFLVDSVIAPDQIAGRNDAIDIPVGTTFTRITKSRVDGDLMHLQTTELGDVATVAIRLVGVELYRKRIDFVPGGYTAILFVDGDGIDALTSLLDAIADREYFWLVADAAINFPSP